MLAYRAVSGYPSLAVKFRLVNPEQQEEHKVHIEHTKENGHMEFSAAIRG